MNDKENDLGSVVQKIEVIEERISKLEKACYFNEVNKPQSEMPSYIRTYPFRKHSMKPAAEPSYNILLVDDCEINTKILGKSLQNIPSINNIYTAVDGLDALGKFHKNDIDIVILDKNMPNLDGILTSKILRKLEYDKVIFGCTGSIIQSDIDEFVESGVDYIFTKPMDKEKIALFLTFIKNNSVLSVPNKHIVLNDAGVLEWI